MEVAVIIESQNYSEVAYAFYKKNVKQYVSYEYKGYKKEIEKQKRA